MATGEKDQMALKPSERVMHGLSEPPTLDNWIGVEHALNRIEERRRLRHKASVYKMEAETQGGHEGGC